jgi:hypothetical protein
LELGFPCVGLLGDLFLCLILFLWGKVRGPSAGSLLSVCYAGLMTVFQFCNENCKIYFGCCSLAQEMSFVNHYLSYFRHRLITHPLSAFLPFQTLFTESSHGD